MSKQFELDEKTALPIATVLLFGIGALKILLFDEHYNLAITNYISFSNILVYTFNVLRGLLFSAIPIVIFIISKDWFIPRLKKPLAVCISLALLCVSILLFFYCCKFIPMNYWPNFWTKYLLEFGVFCAGVCIKSRKWVGNFEIVKLVLLVFFLYEFVKVESLYVVHQVDKNKDGISKIVLKNNGSTDSTIRTNRGNYIILTTTDFVFLYNDTTKHVTTIPMANILLFVDRMVDTAKLHN